ncbi:hypothetical protein GHT06_008201 [Daphnia sinensis]|uniref:Uncharacterized protein n=1 Tax=Daphnia sinensis TaxID=1820382 RepID=A0AAD5L1P2_9CRUS|nr:hypothetical protein GHT06_008201 [Daphnia sinensis]
MLWTDVELLAIEARRQGRTLSMRKKKNEKFCVLLFLSSFHVAHMVRRTAANKTTHFSLLFYFSCGRTAPQ